MSLQRTQVLLEEWQHERLKELAHEQRVTMSELIRRMVTKGLEEVPRRRKLMDLAGIGKGKGRGLKALDEEIYGSGS